MSKTYLELEKDYKHLLTVLRCAMDNAMHAQQCPCNLTEPITFDEDLRVCVCWVKDADIHLRPDKYREKKSGVYHGMNDGPPCKCGHAAGAHAKGGEGLCSRESCVCMKFNEVST